MVRAHREDKMRGRLTYGRGPRLIATLFLAILIAATVLAIAHPGARGSSQRSLSTLDAEFAGIRQNGTFLGDSHAPATLVEFADLQCPFCAQYARDALPGLLRNWVRPGRLRLDLQLLSFIGPGSRAGARLAGAAALQDRLWQFSELFFLSQGTENSGYVTPAFLSVIGDVTPGLDVQRALAARGSAAVTAQLARAQRSAVRLHVRSTPSFFLMRPGRTPLQLRPPTLTTKGLSSAIEAAL